MFKWFWTIFSLGAPDTREKNRSTEDLLFCMTFEVNFLDVANGVKLRSASSKDKRRYVSSHGKPVANNGFKHYRYKKKWKMTNSAF